MRLKEGMFENWEAEYYSLAAFEVIEVMRQNGVLGEMPDGALRITSEMLFPDDHQRLHGAYDRGWRPDGGWLFDTIVQILGPGPGPHWTEERLSTVITYVDDYSKKLFTETPEDN